MFFAKHFSPDCQGLLQQRFRFRGFVQLPGKDPQVDGRADRIRMLVAEDLFLASATWRYRGSALAYSCSLA